jgi:hypothetical protein
MQKNSTSVIIRRAALVVAFGLLTHLFARLFWHLQVFGMNTVPINCRIEESKSTQSDWIVSWTHEVCDASRGTDFVQYLPLSDTMPILGTHFLGLIVSAILFAVFAWIIFGPKREEDAYRACANEGCQCTTHHKPQIYVDGEWEFADCTDPNCPCTEHGDMVFDTALGKWVDR